MKEVTPIMVDAAGFKAAKIKSDFAASVISSGGAESVPAPVPIGGVSNGALAGALAGVLATMTPQPPKYVSDAHGLGT